MGFIRLIGKIYAAQEIRAGLPVIYPRLWRYALVLSGNRVAADDLAQATALRALEKADKYLPGTHLDRWLFRLAHRIWLNELRAQSVRRGGGLVAIEDVPLPDPKPGAEANIFLSEVLATVSELPEAQRVAVVLVYVEGFKYAEAADILDVPVGTIMSRLAAARKTISGKLSDVKEGTG